MKSVGSVSEDAVDCGAVVTRSWNGSLNSKFTDAPDSRYRCRMVREDRGHDEPEQQPGGRFADDLIGLDPFDPEARAFAEHLDKMERPNSKATIEGMLEGVEEFAGSANRTEGHRRVVVVLVVLLILIGVAVAVWNSLGFMVNTFFG